MKTTNLLKITMVLWSIFAIISCSKDDDNPAPTPTPAPAPVVNKALIGLFDITINGNIEANLLFESENRVTYGFETIYDMSPEKGRRTAYTITNNNIIQFSTTISGTTFNYMATYEPSTGKLLSGTYGFGTSYTGGGTFIGTKYSPTGTGNSLFKGYWKGKGGAPLVNPSTFTSNFYMLFEENNKLTVSVNYENMMTATNSVATGTYSISGNNITGSYTFPGIGAYAFTATYNPTTKKITGNIGISPVTSGENDFFVEAQNFN